MPVNVLRIVYLALVQSIIQYGVLGWGGIGKSNLTPLVLLQKRIIKICLHKPLDYPTKLIYQEFGVLNIDQIYKYILLSYLKKNRNKFKIVPHYYSTRKNEVYFLQETKCHTTAGMKHSINFGPRLYNSLIKSNPELHELSKTKFKKKLDYLYKFCKYQF